MRWSKCSGRRWKWTVIPTETPPHGGVEMEMMIQRGRGWQKRWRRKTCAVSVHVGRCARDCPPSSPFSRTSEPFQKLGPAFSTLLCGHSFSPSMLAFFKSPPKQPKSTPDSDNVHVDVAIESTPVQDASSADPADQAQVRVSSASVPTIDSIPTIQGLDASGIHTPVRPHSVPLPDSPSHAASLVPPSLANAQGSVHTESSVQSDHPMQSQSQSALPYSPPGADSTGKDPRRFSFPSFSFLRPDTKQNKAVSKPSEKKSKTSRALSILIVGTAASSEKRARESAAIVRSVIVGQHNSPPDSKSNKTRPVSKYDMARVKSQLLDPKIAVKVISNLRALPAQPNDGASSINVPIHAVCLDMPDKDIHEQYFARFASVATASASTIATVLADVHLIDLLTAPNMGFGAPVTAQGLFAGAVPTAETVVEGIEQITPQLLALGYATGKSILPDHKGVIVPTDRISVLTCKVHSTSSLSLANASASVHRLVGSRSLSPASNHRPPGSSRVARLCPPQFIDSTVNSQRGRARDSPIHSLHCSIRPK